MPLVNVGLRFDSGLVIGRWTIPNPQTRPQEFLEVANDIGFHVATEIARGATGCFFVDLGEEVRRGAGKETGGA